MIAPMTIITTLTQIALLIPLSLASSLTPTGDWSRDPAWFQGKAEWALYDAQRAIYGKQRAYEATLFTNTQLMDPKTSTKCNQNVSGAIEVFKLNLSEQIPTENYVYRFLTTSFVHRADLSLYKLTTSTQEDCGSTFGQFLDEGNGVTFQQYNYFPGPGQANGNLGSSTELTFFNALPLTLRNFPFPTDQTTPTTIKVNLIADQTTTKRPNNKSRQATITYEGREKLTVPIGAIWTHHLSLIMEGDDARQATHFWMAEDARHVMVKYTNPNGTSYRLKRLAWWAYWNEPQPLKRDDLLGSR